MAMYYPDLQSVKKVAEQMRNNEAGKEYNGIIPENEKQLEQARKELGSYFREVWNDEIAALEVELALTEENYHEKLQESVMFRMLGYDQYGNRI